MVQTVERCSRILRLVAHSPGGMKLSDVAEQMELKYTTVYNLADSLLRSGMLEKADGRFFPGPAVGELDFFRRRHRYLSGMTREILRLGKYSRPHSFVFSVPHGTQIHALLWKECSEREPRRVLQFLPPLDSVAGMVMLAFLPPKAAAALREAHRSDPVFRNKWGGSERKLNECVARCRETGYAELPYEAPDVLRIAVPVFADGKLIGALTWTRRTEDRSEREAMLPHLLALEGPESETTSSETLFQA